MTVENVVHSYTEITIYWVHAYSEFMNIVEVYFSSISTKFIHLGKFHPSHIHLLCNFHQFSYIVCKRS
jgi:hypothetical protein